MDDLPILRPRTTKGPLGYLNYPPEIMNQIYHEVLVDDKQVLAFLCSPDPGYRSIILKKAVSENENTQDLDWQRLHDELYYTDSDGLSAQFLRTCKKIWSEAPPVLYGNLNIAMRWTPVQPDPCLKKFFKCNTACVLAWAQFRFPRILVPWPDQKMG